MLRLATLVALGALVAAPASAQSIRISTAGKSAEQVQAEVHKAAAQLCRDENERSALDAYLRSACIQGTVRDAMAQASAGAVQKVATR